MTSLPLALLLISGPGIYMLAESPKWIETPTQIQAPAVEGFLRHWNKHNPTSKPWAWFLCVEGSSREESVPPPFLEPQQNLLESLKKEFPNVFPLSHADPIPHEGPAYILQKGTKTEGAYLRIGLARELSPTKWQVNLSFYAGSHYGGGFQVTLVYKNHKWLTTKVESTFIA